ncbi:small multi-drug export protein [bacterium]|nr:small multi-drug export protein [bacterium]
MNPYLATFLLAMTPVGELRASLPLAILGYKIPVEIAFLISYLGNIIPPILIILFLDPISQFLSKKSIFFKNFFDWIFRRTRTKSKIIERYEMLGLVIFIAIPLPLTGAWTGSIASFLLGMKPVRAILSVLIGVLIAGVIVTLSTLGIVSLF